MLKPHQIVKLLNSYGFSGIALIDKKDKTSDFKYSGADQRLLLKVLGEPESQHGGSVLVYDLPTFKIGITNTKIRFIDKSKEEVGVADDRRVKLVIPDHLELDFNKAASIKGKRVSFLERAFKYFNTELFHSKLPEPKFYVGDKPPLVNEPNVRKAYGVFWGGYKLGGKVKPGNIYISNLLFQSKVVFFAETFVHEMCHQWVAVIDGSHDRSEQGHGPEWKRAMRMVGLDPNRYSQNDTYEFKSDDPETMAKEAELTSEYGPRSTIKEIKKYEIMNPPRSGPCMLVYEGRISTGVVNIQTRKFIPDKIGTMRFQPDNRGMTYKKQLPTLYEL